MARRRGEVRAGLGAAAFAAMLLASVPAHASPPDPLAGQLVRVPATTGPTPPSPLRPQRIDADRRLTVQLMLRGRRPRALERFAGAVSDPESERYGDYLTPEQALRRFGPPREAVGAVRAWAAAAGLNTARVSRSRRFVTLSGPARRVEAAFATRVRTYAQGDRMLQVASRAPRLPAGVGRRVAFVAGLGTEPELRPAAPPPSVPGQHGPCSSWWGERSADEAPAAYGRRHPWVTCGYTPQQLRSAYGVADVIAAGLDGRGQSVGIVGVGTSPTVQADLKEYARRHRLPPFDVTIRDALSGEGIAYDEATAHAWYVEQALDIEAVHALAPRAAIVYQPAFAPRRTSLMNAIDELIVSGDVQIISLSFAQYGERFGLEDPPGRYEIDEQIFAMATAEGIGLYAASGDLGDGNHNPVRPRREANWPAISRYVTGVGGTTLAVGASGQRLFEFPWGTTRSQLAGGSWTPALPGEFVSGGGGGTSEIQAQPDYQTEVVPETIAYYWRDHQPSNYSNPYIPGRAVPDIAAVGDPSSGFVTGMTLRHPDGGDRYGEFRLGGTSLATPLIAALMALADQAAGEAHGHANPALYELAGSEAFHDIEPPPHPLGIVRNDAGDDGEIVTSLATMSQLGTLTSAPGYDDTTGLGTPNGVAFLRALAPRWSPPQRRPDPPPEQETGGEQGDLETPPHQHGSQAPAGPAAPGHVRLRDPAGSNRKRCSRRASIVLRRSRGGRIVRVVVYSRGRRLRAVRGHDVRVVRLRRPRTGSRRVRVVTLTSRGGRSVSRRTLRACSRQTLA